MQQSDEMGDAAKAQSDKEAVKRLEESIARDEEERREEEKVHSICSKFSNVVNAQSEKKALRRLEKLLKQASPIYLKKSFEKQEWRGNTPLASACLQGWPKVAKRLILAGADPNETNCYGDTPLHLVCRCLKPGMAVCVKVLIETGNANVNAVGSGGRTPLHDVACETEKARLLVEAGANVMALDDSGATPLHYVTSKKTAKVLLQAGADVNFKNKNGLTPLHHCLAMGSYAAIPLIENGADLTALAPSVKMGESDETMMTPIDFMAETLSRLSSECVGLQGCVCYLTNVLPVMVEHSTAEFCEAHPNVLAKMGGQLLQRIANAFTGDYDGIMDFVGPLLAMGADINYAGEPAKWFNDNGCEIPFTGGVGYTPLHCLLSPNREVEFHEDCEDHEHGLDGYVLDMVDEIRQAVQSCGQKINWRAMSADGTTLLHLAVPAYPRTAERLVELAGQQDQEQDSTSGEESPSQKQSPFIDACMGDERKTALHVAAMKEDGIEGLPSSVGTLLRLGANPQATTADANSTALHLACQYGNSATSVTCLLQHESNGAGLWNAVDSSGKSALHHAAGRSDSTSLSLQLVRPFMALTATQNHETKDGVGACEQLNVDILDEKNQTPLHALCCVGRETKGLHKIVMWLLDNTRDAETSQWLDQYGMTPLAWLATQKPHNVETLTSTFALFKKQVPFLSAAVHRIRTSHYDGAQRKESPKKRRTNNYLGIH